VEVVFVQIHPFYYIPRSNTYISPPQRHNHTDSALRIHHTMPRKVIIDTDPGVDDVLAILLALSSPEIDLTLISIVFGNTHAPEAYKNLLKIYYQLSLELDAFPEGKQRYERLFEEGKKTKLALGEDGPVDGEKAVAAYFVSTR
jgi:hypothetical protein